MPERDLDDVVQTAFLLYWARRDEVEDPEAWIVATFRAQCQMYWRSKGSRREDEAGLEIGPFGAHGPSPERGLVSRLTLEEALVTLPERQRRLVRLRVVEGLSTSEAAAELGYTRASIQKTLRRTLRRLRAALESSDGPEPLRKAMTTRELAEAAGVPSHTVEHYRRRGLLPVVGAGKCSRLRYPEALETLRRIRRPRERPQTKGRRAGQSLAGST